MDNVALRGSRSESIFIVTILVFTLTTVFVLARLVSRVLILKRTSLDDWCIIVAWFLAFGLTFVVSYATRKGLGRHDSDIPASSIGTMNILSYSSTIFYNPALMACKSSILIFYLRLSKNTEFILRAASYLTLGFVNVAGIILTFTTAFQCRPVRAAFAPNTPGDCFSIITIYLCTVPINLVTDLAILVLPIPVLTSMQMPRKQKAILIFTFSLGIFVTIIDVVRVYYLQQGVEAQITLTGQRRIGNTEDFAWTASLPLMWATVEVNTGIICACIPTLRPLITRISPPALTDRSKPNKPETAGSGSQRPDNEPSGTGNMAPRAHSTPSREPNAGDGGETGGLDFITTPNMDWAPQPVTRSDTVNTQDPGQGVYFGFVDVKGPKSMLSATGKESLRYCTIVTVLFSLWGFSYGLLSNLMGEISGLTHRQLSETLGIASAYVGAYLFGPLTLGLWVLRRWGFKATFIIALIVYVLGTLMFWPPAVLASYPGFVTCQFVVGLGSSILETGANPFLVFCGPPRYAEFRLLLAQGAQAAANIIAQILAQRVLFKRIASHDLVDVQWTYIAIAFLSVILGLTFFYMPLPEATEEDLQSLAERLPIPLAQNLFSTKIRIIYITIALAMFAQFAYVGAQQCMLTWQRVLLGTFDPSSLTLDVMDYTLLAQSCFAISRFLFAPLCLFVAPRLLLLICFTLSTVFAILMMLLHISGNGMATLIIMVSFFEGPIFPLILAIGLRGAGRWAKYVAAGLTASIGGGAGFPYVMLAITDGGRKRYQYSFCVVVALLAFGTILPAYLVLVPKAGRQINPTGPNIASHPLSPCRRLVKKVNSLVTNLNRRGSMRRGSGLPVMENGSSGEMQQRDVASSGSGQQI